MILNLTLIILFAGNANESDDKSDDNSESGTVLEDTDDSTSSDVQYEKSDYVRRCWRKLIRKQKDKKMEVVEVWELQNMFNNLKFP